MESRKLFHCWNKNWDQCFIKVSILTLLDMEANWTEYLMCHHEVCMPHFALENRTMRRNKRNAMKTWHIQCNMMPSHWTHFTDVLSKAVSGLQIHLFLWYLCQIKEHQSNTTLLSCVYKWNVYDRVMVAYHCIWHKGIFIGFRREATVLCDGRKFLVLELSMTYF